MALQSIPPGSETCMKSRDWCREVKIWVLKSLCCAWSSLQRLPLRCSAPLGAKSLIPPPAPGALSWFGICLMIESYFLRFPAQRRSPTSANAIFCGGAGVKAEVTGPYRAHHLQLWDNVLFLPRSSPLPNSLMGWGDSSILGSVWDFLPSFLFFFFSALVVLVGLRRREGRMYIWRQNSLQPIANKASPGRAPTSFCHHLIRILLLCNIKRYKAH